MQGISQDFLISPIPPSMLISASGIAKTTHPFYLIRVTSIFLVKKPLQSNACHLLLKQCICTFSTNIDFAMGNNSFLLLLSWTIKPKLIMQFHSSLGCCHIKSVHILISNIFYLKITSVRLLVSMVELLLARLLFSKTNNSWSLENDFLYNSYLNFNL